MHRFFAYDNFASHTSVSRRHDEMRAIIVVGYAATGSAERSAATGLLDR